MESVEKASDMHWESNPGLAAQGTGYEVTSFCYDSCLFPKLKL